jgi:hypothetical protein
MTSDADYSPKYDDWSKNEHPPDWQNRRRIVLEQHDYKCQKCGIKDLPENDVALEVDHKIPKSKGGSHALDNLQPLCTPCHADKHPDHDDLQQRAAGKPSNSTSPLVALFMAPVWLFQSFLGGSDDGIENISPEDDRADLTAEVNQLWDPNHENIQQTGLLVDGDDAIKFTSWKNNGVKQLQEGNTYRIEYASVDEYEGDPQLELDTYTEIEHAA